MRNNYLIILLFCLISSCDTNSERKVEIDEAKESILAAEAAFDLMAREVGVKEAFVEFAADSAVLQRRGIVKGKKAIAEFFDTGANDSTYLSWKPDFVDVAASGDLGYTYGKFTYVTIDSTGNRRQTNGIFHTVWKLQNDGTWKYVYD